MGSENSEFYNKRFILSPEGREVLPHVKDGFISLKEDFPEVIGMTVFGSMVKGTANSESDVDGFIFLDKQKLSLAQEDYEWAQMNADEHTSTYDLAVVNHYSNIFRDSFRKVGLSETHIEGIRVRSLDTQEVEDILKDAVKQKAIYLEKIQQNKEYVDSIGTENEKEPVTYPPYEEDAQIPWKIPAMFHLQIGHDLDKYREVVITTLEGAGEVGEVLWREIIAYTADLERNMRGYRYEHLFPTTITAAKEYYGIA